MEPEKIENYINFRRIGFEFRRIDKNNSPIITAALIINQSLNNPSAKLEEIIKSRDYQNLLKASVIFYRRFESDPILHFRQLVALYNWSTGNHLGEYVFFQVILSIPDIPISGEEIKNVIQIFPTLFEPIFISKIYTHPELLFSETKTHLSSNQPVSVEFLMKCGADKYFIEKFLTLTFNPSLNFFRQICESRRYQILLGLLSLRPDFFIAIENICRDDLFEVINQIMNSGIQTFLNVFFNYYQNIPTSIIKCVINNLSPTILNQYARDLDKKHYQNLFNFIFQNERPEMVQDEIAFGENFIPCLHELYQKNPDLVLRIFRKTNNQVLNSAIGSYIISSSDNFYSLPFSLIESALSKPDFASEIQNENPQFFIFILNRYPSCATTIAEIITGNRRKTPLDFGTDFPNLDDDKSFDWKYGKPKRSSNQPKIQKMSDRFSNKNFHPAEMDDNDIIIPNANFKSSQNKEPGKDEDDEIIPIANKNQILRLIYEINEEAYCRCFLKNSNSIMDLLDNFVPKNVPSTSQDQEDTELPSSFIAPPPQTQINCKTNNNENTNGGRYRHPNTANDNDNNNNDRYRRPHSPSANNTNNKEKNYHPFISINKNKNNQRGPGILIANSDTEIKRHNSDPSSKDNHPLSTSKPISVLSRKDINSKPSRLVIRSDNNNKNDNNNNDNKTNENIGGTNQSSEIILNPYHLHFPSLNFFATCERKDVLREENLKSFFSSYINFIVDDPKWMSIIPQVPLLFYQFTNVLFTREELSKHNLPLTISFITNMYSTFRTNRESFIALTEFLLNNQMHINSDNFPLYLKIKLLSLIVIYFDNIIGPFRSLFAILVKDYRCLMALDQMSKDMFFNLFIRENLDDPNCHRAFIMIYDNHSNLIHPIAYLESIIKNKDAISMTLSDDEIYFEKWYNMVVRDQNNPVMQTIFNSMRGGQDNFDHDIILDAFRTILTSALNYPKFQNDTNFLSLLYQYLDPRSQIYNANVNNNNENPHENPPIRKLSLNISRDILKIILKKKKELDHNQSRLPEMYSYIYGILITYYADEIFRTIPIPPPTINEEPNAAPR